jgi:hypothetical protein
MEGSSTPRWSNSAKLHAELDCHDDHTRFEERVGKLVKHKLIQKAPE